MMCLISKKQINSLLLVACLPLAGCQYFEQGEDSILPDLTGYFTPADPAAVARDQMTSNDPDLRAKGIAFFADQAYGHEEVYLRYYRGHLNFKDSSSVRLEAVKALGRHGTVEDAAKHIAPVLLKDSSQTVRWQAANGLCQIHNPSVVPALVNALQKDSDNDVKMACARALGQYATHQVFDVLVVAVDDPDYGVSYEASQSLALITGQDFGDDAVAWLSWSTKAGKAIFSGQKQYTYRAFLGKQTILDKTLMWRKAKFHKPQKATGAK